MRDNRPQAATTARLVYVVGASGSGKDSLMCYARARLAANPGVVFAHRYITRAADAGGENHIALSASEFATRRQNGLFALDWESHDHAYGIGIEIDHWLDKGVTVVVNGSRDYLLEARKRYPTLLAAWIDVSTDTLRTRLAARGRENAAAIAARLERHCQLKDSRLGGATICNNGELAVGGEALVAVILQCSMESPCA